MENELNKKIVLPRRQLWKEIKWNIGIIIIKLGYSIRGDIPQNGGGMS